MHVFLGHKRIVKIQLRPVLSIHEQTRLANGKAGRTAFKQYRTNAVQARAKPDINKNQFGLLTICGKHLSTGNVITAVSRRPEGSRVGNECVSTCRSGWSPSN